MLNQSEQVGELVAALAKAQGDFIPPKMTATATISGERANYKFKYAPLDEGFNAVRIPLSENQIAIMQRPFHEDREGKRYVMLETRIAHGEQWMSMVYPVADFDALFRSDDGKYRFDPKKLGAAITYAKRYSLFAFLGLAGEEDIDGDNLDLATERGNGRKPRSVAPLTGEEAVELEGRLIAEVNKLGSPKAMSDWARDARNDKLRLPEDARRRLDAEFAKRMEQISDDGGEFVP